jgi:hypothetical protein
LTRLFFSASISGPSRASARRLLNEKRISPPVLAAQLPMSRQVGHGGAHQADAVGERTPSSTWRSSRPMGGTVVAGRHIRHCRIGIRGGNPGRLRSDRCHQRWYPGSKWYWPSAVWTGPATINRRRKRAHPPGAFNRCQGAVFMISGAVEGRHIQAGNLAGQGKQVCLLVGRWVKDLEKIRLSGPRPPPAGRHR